MLDLRKHSATNEYAQNRLLGTLYPAVDKEQWTRLVVKNLEFHERLSVYIDVALVKHKQVGERVVNDEASASAKNLVIHSC